MILILDIDFSRECFEFFAAMFRQCCVDDTTDPLFLPTDVFEGAAVAGFGTVDFVEGQCLDLSMHKTDVFRDFRYRLGRDFDGGGEVFSGLAAFFQELQLADAHGPVLEIFFKARRIVGQNFVKNHLAPVITAVAAFRHLAVGVAGLEVGDGQSLLRAVRVAGAEGDFVDFAGDGDAVQVDAMRGKIDFAESVGGEQVAAGVKVFGDQVAAVFQAFLVVLVGEHFFLQGLLVVQEQKFSAGVDFGLAVLIEKKLQRFVHRRTHALGGGFGLGQADQCLVEKAAGAGQIAVETGWREDDALGQGAEMFGFAGGQVGGGAAHEECVEVIGQVFLEGGCVDFLQVFRWNFVEINGGDIFPAFAVFEALAGVAQVQFFFGAGHGDIEKAAVVFFQFHFFVGDQAFDQAGGQTDFVAAADFVPASAGGADQKDFLKFQSLGAVRCHQLHGALADMQRFLDQFEVMGAAGVELTQEFGDGQGVVAAGLLFDFFI